MRALLVAVVLALRAASPVTLFALHDHRLDEVSGIDRGIVSADVYYVENDSGDSARVFALDRRTGDVRAEIDVAGATNVDWEDLAVARDAAGTPSVWLADIGDNDGERDSVQLYRIAEPRIGANWHDRTITVPLAQTWRLRYPDGPVNAESLAVTPSGRAYVVTKSPDGRSGVLAVPPDPSGAVQTMTRVGAVTFRAHLPVLHDPQVEATGAAFSPDGRLLVVRTYTDAYLWTVRGGDVAAALRTSPRHLTLPLQQQGEAVCFDGTRLILASEGVGTDVLGVPLDMSDEAPPTRTPTPVPTGTPTPVSTETPTPVPTRTPTPQASTHHAVPLLAGAAAVLVALVAALAWRRSRRRLR